jgi:hypothetical protein
MVRRVCLWISARSQGSGYGNVGSRRYLRPCRSVNGCEKAGGSVSVSCVPVVRLVEPTVLGILLGPVVDRGVTSFVWSLLLAGFEDCALAALAAAIALLYWAAERSWSTRGIQTMPAMGIVRATPNVTRATWDYLKRAVRRPGRLSSISGPTRR